MRAMLPRRAARSVALVLGVLALSIPATADEGETIVLNELAAGATVDVSPGERIEVQLEAQPGTGYAWVPAGELPAFVTLESSEFEPAEGLPGGTERARLAFSVAEDATGEAELVLHYRRPWEKDAPPARTWSVTLQVVDR